MKTLRWFPCAVLLAVSALAQAQSDNGSSPKKSEKVTKLDGTTYFGIVEMTDDYTLRINGDTGLQKIPLALLGEKDFKKFSGDKDRSQDGRLWSERQTALEDTQKKGNDPQNPQSKEDKAAIEIRLAEISALQPLIDAYEKTLAVKKPKADSEKKGDANPEKTADSSKQPFQSLFSQDGPAGPLAEPFTGIGGTALQPAASAGSTVLDSASGVSGLPSVPTP